MRPRWFAVQKPNLKQIRRPNLCDQYLLECGAEFGPDELDVADLAIGFNDISNVRVVLPHSSDPA